MSRATESELAAARPAEGEGRHVGTEAHHSRLGPIGIALAILILISIVLAAFYCTFPWSMVSRPPTAP